MNKIDLKDLVINPTEIWAKRWFLLTAGDMENHNTMTVAWGSIGTMWAKPFVQVVVRHSRYTFEFMNQHDTFTLCSFPEAYKKDLGILGQKSGRDGDKIAETKLTAIPSEVIPAPSFKEADLSIECKKIYFQDMEPENFLADYIGDCYPQKDYHRIYFGEILSVSAEDEFIG